MTFDISAGVEDLIDAAIDCEVLHSPGTSDFLKQGGYYVYNSPVGAGSMILPGRGAPAPDVPADNINLEVLDPHTFHINGQSAASMYAKWETRIYELFYPFKTMPRPEDFDPAIDKLDQLLPLLAIQPELYANTSDDGGGGPLGFSVTGNDDFTLIESASAEFAVMQGLTADAFRKYYLDRFPLVTQRQYGVAQMLKAAVVGEQQVWERLQRDVRALVTDATNAFNSNGQGGGEGSKQSLEVAGVVAAVATLIPPIAAAAGVAATVIGVLTVLPIPKGTPHTYSLPGTGAEEIWSSVVHASDTIKDAAGDQERTLGDHMDDIHGFVDSDPGLFDLGRIDDSYGPAGQSADEELNAETDPRKIIGVIDINYDIVISTGQDLIDVAHVFDDAAKLLNGSLTSGAWSRSGEIGSGYIGHYEQTASLAQSLVTTLRGTYAGLTNAGQVIQLVARQLRDHDGDVGGNLRDRQRRLELAGAGKPVG